MHRPLKEVLAAISVELASLAEIASSLQALVPAQALGEDEIEGLQGLDRLTQSLACLAPFVAAVGSAVPCACGLSLERALDRITLAALARRLAGGAGTSEHEMSSCELFE